MPTFGEQGCGELTTEERFGFYTPARAPAAVVATAHAAIVQGPKDMGVIVGLTVVGLLTQGCTPDEMARSQRAAVER